jgi:hypothetical protein
MIENEPIRPEKISRVLADLLERFALPNANGDQARRRRPRSPTTTPK